jgi:hypothetical protein
VLAACACLLAACASQPQIQPLPVKQVQPGQSMAPDPALALVSGRLAISEEGKSKVPYDVGTDAGCVAGVAAAMIVLLPLAILAGGVPDLGSPDCESKPPALALVHLESRKAGPLSVGADGRFSAQLVPGTYLVPEVWDNAPIAATMVFQAPSPGRAYYLGDVAPKWNAYLDRVVAELESRGIHLLTAAPPSLAPTDRTAIVAAFDSRRRAIEAKWATKFAETNKRYCYNVNHRPIHCRQMLSEVEAERDAELKGLDEEQRLVLGSD